MTLLNEPAILNWIVGVRSVAAKMPISAALVLIATSQANAEATPYPVPMLADAISHRNDDGPPGAATASTSSPTSRSSRTRHDQQRRSANDGRRPQPSNL